MKKIHMEGELIGDFYRAEEVAQLIREYKQNEKEYAELKIIAANRGAFIDWCGEHHEEILKEYTGFTEAGK